LYASTRLIAVDASIAALNATGFPIAPRSGPKIEDDR
jgi:hypothetical protein